MPTPGPCSALWACARPAPPKARAGHAQGGDPRPALHLLAPASHHPPAEPSLALKRRKDAARDEAAHTTESDCAPKDIALDVLARHAKPRQLAEGNGRCA